MRSLLPALMCCLSLFSLETQPLVLPLPTQRPKDWARFLRIPRLLETPRPIMPTASVVSVANNNNMALRYRRAWKALLHKGSTPEWPSPVPDQKHLTTGQRRPRALRGRRHTNAGGGRGHTQLMRVGCVLGTCQVQNLSHRLYQLIGQSGREDSSPINPRSPHSYG